MSLGVLALVLGAAALHATWNLLAKGAQGGAAFVWLSCVAAALLYLPALVIALAVAPGPLGAEAALLMAVSGALHATYFVLLQRGYAVGDLSLIYPLARGTGPLLSATAAIVFLGERPSAIALTGAAIIVAAVLSLVAGAHPAQRPDDRKAVELALLTGVTIAAYTLWDKHAVASVALSPIVYYCGTNLANGLLLTPWVIRHPQTLRLAWETSWRQAAAVGALSALAYVLVLYALVHAAVSAVAPARESSIVIGTMLGATVLREGDTRRRVIAACATLVGITALALG